MLKYNLVLAFRYLIRNPFHSFINLIGIVLAVTASWFVFSYVAYEYSYDTSFQDLDRIYRVNRLDLEDQSTDTRTVSVVGPTLSNEFTSIDATARLAYFNRGTITVNQGNSESEKLFSEPEIAFADPSFFKIFNVVPIATISNEILKENSVVLSRTLAEKYFSSPQEAVGKTINLRFNFGSYDYQVSSVIDFPENSHLDIPIVFSIEIFDREPISSTTSTWNFLNTYVKLKEGVDRTSIEQGADDWVISNFGDEFSSRYRLQAVRDIHLESNFYDNSNKVGDKNAIGLLFIVSILILGIGWINYINLTTARSTERAHEVGIRKTLGSLKRRLVAQFLVETFVINSLAFLIAYMMIQLFYPVVEAITRVEFHQVWIENPGIWLLFLVIFVLSSLISGVYPAFVLSGFNPIKVLKGKVYEGSGHKLSLRKVLVASQFIISGILLLISVSIFSQIQFMVNNKTGLRVENTVIIEAPSLGDSTLFNRIQSYTNELRNDQNVEAVAISNIAPGIGFNYGVGVGILNAPEESYISASVGLVNQQYFNFYELEFVEGNGFISSENVNREGVVLNEEAIRQLGFSNSEESIGRLIDLPYSDQPLRIIGVVKDYNHFSLKNKISPAVFVYNQGTNKISVRLAYAESNQLPAILSRFETGYASMFPGNAFVYDFLEDKYLADYESDQQLGVVISIFTAIALIISILGIVGLASYSALRRMKEIGIRKVLGASTSSLLSLVSKEFILVVVVSQLIVIPVAIISIGNILAAYPYKVDLSIWMYTIPLFITGVITIVTVLIQTWFGTRVNPAILLRDE